MAMSIHNPFCLNLYDIPISAQNFGDTSGIQCNLYLTVCLSLLFDDNIITGCYSTYSEYVILDTNFFEKN